MMNETIILPAQIGGGEMTTKRCARSGRELPVTEFHKTSASKDGLYAYCKECASKKHKENYAKRKEREEKPENGNPELAKFTSRELLSELKSRGYIWSDMYVKQLVFYDKI